MDDKQRNSGTDPAPVNQAADQQSNQPSVADPSQSNIQNLLNTEDDKPNEKGINAAQEISEISTQECLKQLRLKSKF